MASARLFPNERWAAAGVAFRSACRVGKRGTLGNFPLLRVFLSGCVSVCVRVLFGSLVVEVK